MKSIARVLVGVIGVVAVAGCAAESGGDEVETNTEAEAEAESAAIVAWRPTCGSLLTKKGTYVLDRDLSCGGGPAITIETGGVTLDLGGHSVNGSGRTTNGIAVSWHARGTVTILNGTVHGDFGQCVDIQGAATVKFKGTTIDGCAGAGITISAVAARVVVENSTFSGNGCGIVGYEGTQLFVKSSTFRDNFDGIFGDTSGVEIHDSTFEGTGIRDHGTAISVRNSSLVVDNAKIRDYLFGIHVMRASKLLQSSNVMIRNNQIHGTKTGLSISDANGSISSNVVTENKLDISADPVSTSDVTWTKNTFKTTDASWVH